MRRTDERGIMRSTIKLIFIATALLFCSSIPGSGQTAAGADEEQVRAAVERFGKAFVEADVSALESLLSDDYIHVNGSGSVLNKQQWLEYIKSRKAELESGRLKIESYENDDLMIRIHGESAVVTGRNVAKGKRGGQTFTTRLRFTHLWIKEGGQWKRAAFHDSRISQ